MGLIENIKKHFVKEKDAYDLDLERSMGVLKGDLERLQGYIDNNIQNQERWRYCLDESKLQAKVIRKNTAEDIEYRNNIMETYADELAKVVPKDSDLRFHATPSYFVEPILASKSIVSAIERTGYMASSDEVGEISVSTINTLSRSINFFLDLRGYQHCLPSGSLFVLKPKDKYSEDVGRSTMDSVHFDTNPEQLYAIVTTPENVNQIKYWCAEYGIHNDKVFSFDEFIEHEKERENSKRRIRITPDMKSSQENNYIDQDRILNEIQKNNNLVVQQNYDMQR